MNIRNFNQISLILLTILANINQLMAQNKFEITDGVQVNISGFDLEKPFTGGLNSPQFTEFDLNQDGILDLIVFDRVDYKILPYLRTNKNNFLYAPQFEPQLPKGQDIYIAADLNSDGKQDIFTLSEIGDLIIHINESDKSSNALKFKNLGPWYYRNQYDSNYSILYNPLSFANTITDLPAIKDIDGDGDLDIVSYDPFNLTYYMFKDVRAEKGWNKDSFEFQNMDYCFGYFWEGFNGGIILNDCPLDLGFPKKLKPRHVGGASCWFFDEDNDGDQEMYLSNLDWTKIIRMENGKMQRLHEYDTMVRYDSTFLDDKVFNSFMFPAGYTLDIDKDGLTDMVIAPNGITDTKESQQVRFYKNEGSKSKADFNLVKTNFISEQMIDFGARTSPTWLDVNGDGLKDLLVAHNGDYDSTKGMKDRIDVFMNSGTFDNPKLTFSKYDFLNLRDSGYKYLSITAGDIDNDSDDDLLLGTMNGKIDWYENYSLNGKPAFRLKKKNILSDYQLKPSENTAAPTVYDYNNDGINDLLVGFYNGNVALFEGKSKTDVNLQWISSNAYGMRANEWLTSLSEPDFNQFGYASPVVYDIDNDGNLEIILGTLYGDLRIYHPENHKLTDSLIAEQYTFYNQSNGDTSVILGGAWLKPTFNDLTGDTIPELICGTLRGGLIFGQSILSKKRANSTFHSTVHSTFKVYPNPAINSIIIENPVQTSSWNVKIMSSDGRELKQSKINCGEPAISEDVHMLGTGIYFITLENRTQKITQKLIIDRP
mgnify:CR=1 FL=1